MAALRADDDLFHAKVSGLESTLVHDFLARLSPRLGCLNFACICLSKKKKTPFFFLSS